jgi:hypothetical protein
MNREVHPVNLVLALEDLKGDERERAEAHLAGCEKCRRLLKNSRQTENAAALASLSDDEDPLAALDPETRRAAAISQQVLLERFLAGSKSVAWWRSRNGVLGFLALAAALVTMVVISPMSGPEAAFDELRLAPAVVTRDATPTLEPGDELSLRFRSRHDGWPVVVRATDGRVELLCPTAEQPGWQVHEGKPTVIPPPGSGSTWTLGPDPSVERWFLALMPDPVDDPAAFSAELATALTVAGPDAVLELLARRFPHAAEVTPR